MSLAEPRKRRKNPMHTVNLSAPNHWTNDDSKFGQRMLEKFGWSKGSGLGKYKQGISEIIRVQPKVTPTGLGFIANNADDWFKAGEDYSRLLSQLTVKFDQYQSLSAEANSKNSKKSLEQNSLNSRSRVHYHKFTKGKDLTQYKSEELACILGKGVKDEQSSKGLNMKEYFKTKRENKKLKLGTSDSSSNEDSVDVNHDKINDSTTREDLEINGYVDEPKISTTPPQKKTKYELKLTKEIETSPSIKYDNFEAKKKKKKSKEKTDEDLKDTSYTENKLTKITTDEDVKQVKETNSKKLLSDNMDDLKQSKRKILKPLSDESLNETEQTIKKKHNADDDAGNRNGECDRDDYKKTDEQNSESVLSHKYQNLVDLLIENSSAGKKYSKDFPSSLFNKKMKEFAESVKHQLSNTIDSVETEPVGKKPTSVKLNPDDKDFIRNFEAQKSEVLENIRKHQEWTYKNDTSQFVVKYGDVLFFGSNINNIKGYGEW